MKTYQITYCLMGDSRPVTVTEKAFNENDAVNQADEATGWKIGRVISSGVVQDPGADPKEEEKQIALRDLLLMEREFTLEKEITGSVDPLTWSNYNSALDKVCEILGIDSVDFAEILEAGMKEAGEK